MKIAFVTQTYVDDHDECVLLCESIDRFVPKEIVHFIFVNDEDYFLFKSLESERRRAMRKSIIIPKYLVKLPLFNTYRFSENFLCACYVKYVLGMNRSEHFNSDVRPFPSVSTKAVDVSNMHTLYMTMAELLEVPSVLGFCIQKKRKAKRSVSMQDYRPIIYKIWDQQKY